MGDDLSRRRRLDLLVAEQRALDLAALGGGLDDHARVVVLGQLDRRVELAPGSLDAADATLEPGREGFTQSGAPISATPSRQPYAPAAANSTWGMPRWARAASGQLAHADRRGRTSEPTSGTSSHSAGLGAAVLSEGTVQAGKATSAASSPQPGVGPAPRRRRGPAPLAGADHARRLVARLLDPRANASPERSETSCSEERPAGVDGYVSSFFDRRLPPEAPCATTIVAEVPGSLGPGGGNWSVDLADFEGASVSCSAWPFFHKPFRRSAVVTASRPAQLADHVRDLRCFLAFGDGNITVEPGWTRLPALGVLADRLAFRCRVRAVPADARLEAGGASAVRPWRPCPVLAATGTLASLGPAETVSTTVVPRVAEVPPRGRSGSPGPGGSCPRWRGQRLDVEAGLGAPGPGQRLSGGRGDPCPRRGLCCR